MRLIALFLIALGIAAPAAAGMRDDLRLVTGARGQLMPVVEEALAAGARIDATDAAGRTALMWAAFHGHAPILRVLIGAGADVNARDRRGRTALMWAALANRADATVALVLAGADAALADDDGADAAAHALSGGHAALAEALSKSRREGAVRRPGAVGR